MTTNGKAKKPLPLVSPEEAIQWLLDTGLFRAKRWEDALDEWDSLSPAQRTAAVSMSLAERNSLRETAGIARRTGYHPKEQITRLSNLVYQSVSRGLEASGLEQPENRMAIKTFWDVVITTIQQAEQELSGPAPGFNDTDDIIDGKVSGEGTRHGEYDEWSSEQLREELSERGLTRGGSRRVLIKKLLRDDARPEDAGHSTSKQFKGLRKGLEEATGQRPAKAPKPTPLRVDDLIEGDALDGETKLEPEEPDEPDVD